MIKCQDKKVCNWSTYVTEGWGLILDSFTYKKAGYVYSWTLASSTGKEIQGETIGELLLQLQNLKAAYNLHSKPHAKDILVIYTDDLDKLYGFLHNYDTTLEISTYFQIYDNIEFRGCWYDDLEDAASIAHWAQFMIDTLFIPDKYYYLTPNQIPRKRMKKARKKLKDTTALDIYPKSLTSYNMLRKAYFGGILYVPYRRVIYDPLIEIDLKSAYIFCLLIEKHCMSASTKVDPEDWEYYLDSVTKASFGKYKITYTSTTNKICCYKNSNGEKINKGDHITDEFNFTDIDLKIMMEHVTIHSVECIYLYEYDLDFMPKYVRDELVYEYTKKELIKLTNPDSEEERIQKIIVNGEYGDSCRKWKNKDEFDEGYSDPNLAPQWGIWATSYCRNMLLSLGNLLKGWYYSATDSIYCIDSPENIKLIEEFNAKTRAKIKEFCDRFGYNYDDLKDLGCFIIKTHINKFRAFGPNTYVYLRDDNEIIIKASGCPKSYRRDLTREQKEFFFSEECTYIPAGKRTKRRYTDKFTSCDIDGKHYESNGSYYELIFDGDMADFIAILEAKH